MLREEAEHRDIEEAGLGEACLFTANTEALAAEEQHINDRSACLKKRGAESGRAAGEQRDGVAALALDRADEGIEHGGVAIFQA